MNPTKVPDFSKRLRMARLAAGFRRKAAIIARLGIHRVQYYRVENGTRGNPPWNLAYRIIVGARLPLECFFPHTMILEAARRIVARR